MKLRQTEYCHNCQQHVTFEFEECNGQQIIDCPSCGHKHYRELDDATLLDIRVDMMRPGTRVYIPPKMDWADMKDGISPHSMVKVEVREVIAVVNGKAAVKPKEGEKKIKVISDRRWGVDPSQTRR